MHDNRFPNETTDYRTARNALLKEEVELRARLEAVAALRRQLPLGGAVKEDYVFDEVDVATDEIRPVRLSELFARGNSLIVYGFMYGETWEAPCPSCTSITDGANGQAQHIRAKTNFVIVAKAAPAKLLALAKQRGWKHLRILSSASNTFNADYFAEAGSRPDPMINVFVKRGGAVNHQWASETFFVPRDGHPRHADLVWPLWSFLDMTPEGRADFMPKLSYDQGA